LQLQDAFHHAQIFFEFVLDNPQDFGELKVMSIWRFLGTLNKMSLASLDGQHVSDLIFDKRFLLYLVHLSSSLLFFACVFQDS